MNLVLPALPASARAVSETADAGSLDGRRGKRPEQSPGAGGDFLAVLTLMIPPCAMDSPSAVPVDTRTGKLTKADGAIQSETTEQSTSPPLPTASLSMPHYEAFSPSPVLGGEGEG